MEALTIRDFQNNMASVFDKVDAGITVHIKRNNKLYIIVPESTSQNNTDSQSISGISKELQADIEQAHKDLENGECVVFNSLDEIDNFFSK